MFESSCNILVMRGLSRPTLWGVRVTALAMALAATLGAFGPISPGIRNARAQQAGRGQQLALERLILPREDIVSGGVPQDGIPAITDPPMTHASESRFLQPSDRVAGVVIEGDARAYPLKVLTRHEIVNDQVGGTPVAVTYCPLCDSVALFDRRTDEGVLEFGVSGLLFNSNVLMYDRGAGRGGLWSQLMAQGVSGPGSGTQLKPLPVELTTWRDWVERYPDTKILHVEPQQQRDYRRDPYGRYHASRNLMFPVKPLSRRLPLKERVLGIWTDAAARAYPLSALERLKSPLTDELDGRKFTIVFNPQAGSARVSEADDGVHWMYSYWFGWYAFHPADLGWAEDIARDRWSRRHAGDLYRLTGLLRRPC